jgi:ssRNA-specific RNase YbeY (16S rRNA maturation enzyme)
MEREAEGRSCTMAGEAELDVEEYAEKRQTDVLSLLLNAQQEEQMVPPTWGRHVGCHCRDRRGQQAKVLFSLSKD